MARECLVECLVEEDASADEIETTPPGRRIPLNEAELPGTTDDGEEVYA
jgi:hypothetical protein